MPDHEVMEEVISALSEMVWHPPHRDNYVEAFISLKNAYLADVNWEDAGDARTAALIPALLLARIDGKSPVEYLTNEGDREGVRTRARALLKRGG